LKNVSDMFEFIENYFFEGLILKLHCLQYLEVSVFRTFC
jgi:hypothetical protein